MQSAKTFYERESQMINLVSSTTIHRPVKQVFDFISASENDAQWQYGALASFQITQNPIGLGTLFSSLGHFLGRRLQGKFEVTEYEPNKKYGFRSLSGPLQLQTVYIFDIFPGGTRVDASMHVSQGGFFKLSDAFVTKFAKKQLKENLAALKTLLESEKNLS